MDVSYFQKVDADINHLNFMSKNELNMKMKEEFVLEDFVQGEESKKEIAYSTKMAALERQKDTISSESEQESQ